MTKVLIPTNTPDDKREVLDAHLKHLTRFEPQWNGATFCVEVHDLPCASIQGCDELNGAQLLAEVNGLLFDEVAS